ncbi:hypothetical protein ACHWQZ_G005169 [Mnemiopsis leidyi]
MRTRRVRPSAIWNLFTFYRYLLMIRAVNSSMIVAQDLYTATDTPPFTITVTYENTADSPILLTCETVDKNSGLSAPNIELPTSTGFKQTVSVVFSGTLNIELPVELSCTIEAREETTVVTHAIIAHSENKLAFCNSDEVYSDSNGNVKLFLYSGSEDSAVTVTGGGCSCNNDAGNPILDNFNLIEGTRFNLTSTKASACDQSEAFCSCTLKCTYNTQTQNNLSVNRRIKLLNPVLHIKSSFKKLTFYKNISTITAYTFPPSQEVTCFANKVTVNPNTFTAGEVDENSDFKHLVLVKLSSGVFHVFPKDSTVTAGIYGIKCSSGSASDTFLFELVASKNSSIAGEKVNFDEYVSVLCSCNRTAEFCDAQCCCDSDCSELQKASFQSCIQGPAGGDHSVKIKPSCSDVSNVSPWERALCIKTSNSAFLGRYFNFVNKSFTSQNVWKDSNIVGVSLSSTSKSTKGYPVFTSSPSNSNTHGFLTLPGKVGGSCISAQPLQLLVNSHTVCSRVVTANCNMELGGVFSALSYLSPPETLVDPCGRFTRVYSNGVDSTEALTKVLYKKGDKILNNLASEILQDQTCLHAVTDVTYQVSVNSGTIVLITATVVLQDLRGRVGETVATSYRVDYVSADVEAMTKKEVSSQIGYSRHEPLLVSSGTFTLPQFGSCDVIGTPPKFGVSAIVQCYKTIQEESVKRNCTELYETLTASYSNIIQNGSTVGSTPGNKSVIPVLQTNPLNTTNLTEHQLCDLLPSLLHISVYHKRSSLSGEEITNITFSFEYGSPGRLAGDRFVLQADLRFFMSDLTEKRSSLSWQDIADFFENRQELLNSLIVLFAAFIYFAIPKNFLSSKL